MLHELRLKDITQKNNCTVNDALEELRDGIAKYAPEGLRTHRSEQDKIEYLSDAIVGAN